MADSYANEWARINSIASQIDSLQQEVDRLEIRYHEISTQLNYLPVDLDEDGYDRNEGQRRMLESQLSMIQDSISQARTNIVIRQDAARSLSAGFMTKARSYREESSKAANVGNEFKRLEGFRFGSSTAAAGGKLANQRSAHYNDHATALEGLAAAADRASMGVSTVGGTGTIADRGTFENPQSRSVGNYNKFSGNKADISFGAGSAASGNFATNGRREITGAMKNRINEDLGAPSGTQKSGSSSSQSSAELEKYAAGAVSTNLTGGEMVDYADSTFAKQYGMSSEEFKQYRQENYYSYVADSGKVHLVHDGISEAGGWTSEPEARGEGREIFGPYYEEAVSLYHKNPDFFPNPDSCTIVQGDELKMMRRQYDSMAASGQLERGHHRQGLAFGGKNVRTNIVQTGESTIRRSKLTYEQQQQYFEQGYTDNPDYKIAKIVENPNGTINVNGTKYSFGLNNSHTEATNFQNKVLSWQRKVGLRNE